MTQEINGQTPIIAPLVGEVAYYVKPTAAGIGDGLSWATACTFRTAVSKLDSTKTTTIYLAGGIHDLDNGSDATGTTISTDYVRIFGMNNELGNPITRLVNGAGAATHILRITGDYVSINNVAFGNWDQTDKNVIMLNIRGSYNDVQRCTFYNETGDGGGTGILVDNSSARTTLIDNQFFSVIDSGVEIGAATDVVMARNNFYTGGKGLYLSSASADRISVQDTEFLGLTTGIDYAAAAANNLYLIRAYFGNCTNNVAAVAAYGNTWLETITESGRHGNTYPLTDGVLCTTGDGVWTWTAAAVTIIPKETLTKPFKITAMHFQTWSAAQTYKIELLYGEDSANLSLGIFEVTLGDPSAKTKVDSPLPLAIYVPAYSMVGVKVMSSTDGEDTITMTLGYEAL